MPNYKNVESIGKPTYDDFVSLWDCEVVEKITEGSYQGNFYFILKKEVSKNIKYSVIDISFGSCGVCDFLMDVLNCREPYVDDNNFDKIRRYFERKRKSIQWYDKDTLIERLNDKDLFSTGFWGLDNNKAIEILKECD